MLKTDKETEVLLDKRKIDTPELQAGCFSRYTLAWVGHFLGIGSEISEKDIPHVSKENDSNVLYKKLEINWNKELKNDSPSMAKAIWNTEKREILNCGILSVLAGLINFCSMCLIGVLIDWFGNHEVLGIYNNQYDALILLVAVLIGVYMNAYVYFWFQYKTMVLGYVVRTECVGLIYRKLFKLNSNGAREATVGKILNVVNNDMRRIDEIFELAGLSCQFPIIFSGTIYQVYTRLGFYPIITVVVGMFIALFGLTFQAVWLGSLRERIAVSTDKRCKAMEELISAIKIIKMYCWESAFLQKVIGYRAAEICNIKKRNYWGHATHRVLIGFGRILTVGCLYVAFSVMAIKDFKSSDIFVTESFITALNWNFGILFWTVFLIREAVVSIERVQEILLTEERVIQEIENDESENLEHIVSLKEITAKWPGTEENVLKNLNLEIKPGSLVGVIGQVGCGKSSFLSLFLNELEYEGKNFLFPNNIAYAPQESWIFGGTIRENILVGRRFVEDHYQKVIEVCSLRADFGNFPNRDQTLIGEKGVTLSGGQRARINLARALYTDASVYLLDDPLAAVDTKVVNDLYQHAITDYLSKKTRILVTHHINLLTNADVIVCLADNSIIFNGTYEEMKQSSHPFIVDIMKTGSTKKTEDKKVKKAGKDSGVTQDVQTEFLLEETKKTGKLGLQFFIDYFLLCGSKLLVLVWLILLSITVTATVFISLQLARVGNTGDAIATNCTKLCDEKVLSHPDIKRQMYFYLGFIGMDIAMQVISVMTYVNIVLGTSQNAHDVSTAAVIMTPMDFFHENPLGRILNRFTKDTDVLDDELVGITDEVIFTVEELIAVAIITVLTNWFSVLLGVPLVCFTIFVRQKYVKTSRELQRIEGRMRSPVNTMVTDAVNGRVAIYSYNLKPYMTNKYHYHQNNNGAAWLLIKQLMAWLQLRLDWILATFYGLIAIMLIYLSINETFVSLFNLTPSMVGLALSQCFLLLGQFQYLIRISCRVENLLTSLERILEYSQLPDETAEINDKGNQEDKFNRSKAKTNLNRILSSKNDKFSPFPAGNIEFKNFSYSYTNNVPVLKNLNVEFKSGEKVGIIGRTGAGKSSLISALYRIRRPMEGSISFNNKDDLTLFEIRKNMSIIPQEPTIFSDTVRGNLDPFSEYEDSYLWNVLEIVGLKEKFETSGKALDFELDGGGANLSVGEKQLLCLGRAILKKSKILLIDEATANVDLKTDAYIQDQIKTYFKDSTVLTVAHRLNTIVSSDKILILEKGVMVEFDEPKKLIQNENSFFRSLVEASKDSAELLSTLTSDTEKKSQ